MTKFLSKIVSNAFNGFLDVTNRSISKLHNGMQLDGKVMSVGGVTCTVYLQDDLGMVLLAKGDTVPTDLAAGFATGCMFIDAGGGVNVTMYVNDGDSADCDFNLGLGGTGDITAVTTNSGSGLSGGASSGAATLQVVVDGATVEIATNTIRIKDAGVSEAKLAASAGFGLGVLRTARAKYSFAVDGGSIGAITPATNATIPNNAIIVGAFINSTTAATSLDAATIAVGLTAGGDADAFLAAEAVASFSTDAVIVGDVTPAAPVKTTNSGSIKLTVADFALTAGIIEVTVLYFVAAA